MKQTLDGLEFFSNKAFFSYSSRGIIYVNYIRTYVQVGVDTPLVSLADGA